MNTYRGYRITTQRSPDGKWQAVAKAEPHRILSTRLTLERDTIENVKAKIDDYLDEPIEVTK